MPESWCWRHLGEICNEIKRVKSPKYVDRSDYLAFAQKSYDSYDEDSDGLVAKDLEGAILLYDGTNVYMAESLKISS
mgnify:CR=1 FL=1